MKAIFDQLGASALPLFHSEKYVLRNVKTRRKHGLSHLFLLVIGSLILFSQIGLMFIVDLGHASMGLSVSGTQLESEIRHSLRSFLQGSTESHGDEEIWPKPYGWESYSYFLMRKHFACNAYAPDQEKPLPTLQEWKRLQSQYNEIVDNTHVFDDPVPPTMGYTFGDGGPPPYYAGYTTSGKGRGLFASRDIKKGELTHDGTNSDIVFPDAISWRKFVFSLPRNRACDMMEWSWTQKLGEKGNLRILSAINISVLLNEGEVANYINVNPESSTSSKFYATGDIKKGDEILMNYGVYDTFWTEVGLGYDNAVHLSPPLVEKSEPHNEPIWPKPDGWDSFITKQIEEHFYCKLYAIDKMKPLPTLQDWQLLRAKYNQHVDSSRSFDDIVPPTMGYTFGDGGPPPYYAKNSNHIKGRSLFASRDIKKGELIHDGTKTNIMFPDAMSWRRFIFSLPRNRACDMVDWSWTEKLEESDERRIFSAIDISVFFNGGMGNGANVDPMSSTSSKLYATRDIKKDEELLTSYQYQFVIHNNMYMYGSWKLLQP